MIGARAMGLRGWLRERGRRRVLRAGSPAMRAYRAGRTAQIRSDLAGRDAPFVYVAGDSHAEFLGRAAGSDRDVVNGGIGGITARVYAAELEGLAFARRAAAAIVFIGSNDIARACDPLARGSIARFEGGVLLLVAALRARAERVWIAAIPPIRPNAAYPQVVEAVPPYNRLLARAAAATGCAHVDPFAHMRDGDEGLARDGFLRDGVHLADYGPLAAAVVPLLRGQPRRAPGG